VRHGESGNGIQGFGMEVAVVTGVDGRVELRCTLKGRMGERVWTGWIGTGGGVL